MICGLLDAALGIVLLAVEYETLRALLKVLPTSDVEMIADVVTVIGASLLGAFALCALAIPQALRYTRWMHEETEPRLASSTARGFPPPPVSAARNSVWRLPIVAPEETRSRRRMYFMLAGFAIGFGGGIGVLVSSTTRSSGGGAAVAPAAGSAAAAETPDPQRAGAGGFGGGGSGGGGGGAGGATAEPGLRRLRRGDRQDRGRRGQRRRPRRQRAARDRPDAAAVDRHRLGRGGAARRASRPPPPR